MRDAVVLTGGSRGLGLAIARRLANEGYQVFTCSRRETDEIRALQAEFEPGQIQWREATLGDEASEEAFFDFVRSELGERPLWGLINNAAIAGEGVLATFPNVDSERIIEINLVSSLRLSRLAARMMLAKRQGGRIINITSIVGLRGFTGLAAYAASKAGMDGMTRALARELGPRQITVNSVAPGYLETELSATLSPRQREQIIRRTPLGRLGSVDDVAPLVTFLIGREAGFITGQTYVVDGGGIA